METSETCLAGVGTLMLEFGTLSRLTNKPIYEVFSFLIYLSYY
jgi:mannosidase alpha-like ER degradation enhancer 1